MMNMIGCWNG